MFDKTLMLSFIWLNAHHTVKNILGKKKKKKDAGLKAEVIITSSRPLWFTSSCRLGLCSENIQDPIRPP